MKEVIVIGAGASGLMAACELAFNGCNVTVLEARNRTGGRIHTIDSLFSLPIEADAEFMHGKQPLTSSLLETFGISTTLLSGNRYQVRNGQREKGDLFDDDWERLMRALNRVERDTSIASFLRENFNTSKDADLVKKVTGFVEGYDAADMDKASAVALREEWSGSDDEHQYQIEGGYGKLIHALEQRLRSYGGNILLSTTVAEIRWSPGKSTVITTSGSFLEAEKVIVTVPLGVLQKNGITFRPPLPQYGDAFALMGFGGVIKFFFEFHTPFWEDSVPMPLPELAFVFSDAEIPTWWSRRPHPHAILTGWLGGPLTRHMDNDARMLMEKAIRSLGYIFQCPPDQIQRNIKSSHIENWVADPLTLGAYAYPTIDTAKALAVASEPVAGTLYFAGEAMYMGSAVGTVEAALASGKEVARKIVLS